MPTVIQNVAATAFAGVASKSIALASTGAGNLLAVISSIQAGSTIYTGATITDNVGTNAWLTAIAFGGTGHRIAIISYCLSVTPAVSSVLMTPTGGTGGAYGSVAAVEVSGGPWALDQTGSGTADSTLGDPITAIASSINIGTTDFVIAVLNGGNGQINTGIISPPSGYTQSFVQQDDSNSAAGAGAYRINSSAVTDSVTWTNTGGGIAGLTVGSPAAIASFRTTGAPTPPPPVFYHRSNKLYFI